GAFDLTVMAGDLAMLGPRPAETIDRLRALNCLIITGNTEQMVVRRDGPSAAWTAEQIGAERLAVLAGLPFSYSVEPQVGHELLIVHANPKDLEAPLRPDSPAEDVRPLVEDVTADVLAFGHIHIPYIRNLNGLMLFDVASAGLPRDGDQRAAYGIAEWTGREWRLEHHRVAYDIDAVVQDILNCGMPNADKAAAILQSARY
ncbi:MAG: metallophosphoesterase family protein, partial [Chloroflexi bacterium]|nr:metallophosphoesterase family protein [Chloroflexota bacterium]